MSYVHFVITTEPNGAGSLIRSGACDSSMLLKQALPGEYAYTTDSMCLPGESTVVAANDDPLFPTATVIEKEPAVAPVSQTTTGSKTHFLANSVDFIEFTGLYPGTKLDVIAPVGSGLEPVIDAIVGSDGIVRITTDEVGEYRIIFEDPNGILKPYGAVVYATR